MVSGIYRSSILQAAVEDRYRGRLGGIARAACATGPSRGEVESCVVASLAGVPAAIVSGGLATTAGVAAIRWYAPDFWRDDARHRRPHDGRGRPASLRGCSAEPPLRFP
jgi:hypothetical protein